MSSEQPCHRAASRALVWGGAVSVPVGLFTWIYPPAVEPTQWGYPFDQGVLVLVSVVLAVGHLLKAFGFVGLSRLQGAGRLVRGSMLAAALGFVVVAGCEVASAFLGGVPIDAPAAVALDNGYGAGSMLFAVASMVGGTRIGRRNLLPGFGRWSVVYSGAFMIFIVTPALFMGRGPAAYLTLTLWSLFFIWIGRVLARPPEATSRYSTMSPVKVVLGVLAVVFALGVGFVATKVARWQPTYPDVSKPKLAATDDPEMIARGEYIVTALAHCAACHTPFEEYAALQPGTTPSFEGGRVWDMGPLGTIRSSNITSDAAMGIGGYTDAELARAIRHGVGKDDRGLLFMMAIGPMSDEDLVAVMSYLRTVAPSSNTVEGHEIGVLGKVLFQGPMEFFQHPHTYPQPEYTGPSDTPTARRGKYLAEGPAGCFGCHSQYAQKDGQADFIGTPMSGASMPQPDEFDPAYEYAAPNLTMDPQTGHLKAWSKEDFVERFSAGRMYRGSPMPWESYRNMTRADVESLWLYLESLPPTQHRVGPPRREAGWDEE